MRPALVEYLPWLLSAVTVWSMWLAGRLDQRAWGVGLFGQVFWAIWIIASEAWGLIPSHLALWYVYANNYLKWRRSS